MLSTLTNVTGTMNDTIAYTALKVLKQLKLKSLAFT
jgi:hypothetical protein